MGCAARCLVLASLILAHAVPGARPRPQGPAFQLEPPAWLEYANSSGAVLSCLAGGQPAPDLAWLDSALQQLAHLPRLRELLANGSLYIPPFAAEDYNPLVHSAVYYCRAANVAGAVISTGTRLRAVLVQDYEVTVRSAYVTRGNVAVLRCDVPAHVRRHVAVTSWLRDDPQLGRTTLHPGGRFSMTSSGSLHIHDTVPSDGYGRYYCWVTDNLTGRTRLAEPGQIVISEPEGDEPPVIEHSSTSVRATAGNAAELFCIGKGNPPPIYRWYQEVSGTLQEMDPSSVLVWPVQSVLQFPRAQSQNAGRYVCSVSGVLGEDRREMELEVLTPLSVRVRPQQQVVDVGSTASFSCQAMGVAAQLSWLKNGSPVVMGDRLSLLQGAQVLTIRPVRKEDRAMYQCVARSEEESAQASAQLSLGAMAPELVSTFADQTLQPGAAVSLACTASGDPPPQLAWLLDGAPPPAAAGYLAGSFMRPSGDVVGHLNVSSARVEHGGLYTCEARNHLGVARHSAAVNVYGPPTARGPTNVTAAAGADADLLCPVAGYPLSGVSWSRGRGAPPLARQPPPEEADRLLRLPRVHAAADQGEYRCVVFGPHGTSAAGTVRLHVMEAPRIGAFHFSPNLDAGMRTLLPCSIVSGDFPISISWRKDGEPLSQELDVQEKREEFASTLVFRRLGAEHSGNYTCTASNAAATAHFTAGLSVRVPPYWLREPDDVSALSSQPAYLHCRAGGHPPPSVAWLRGDGDQLSKHSPLLPGPNVAMFENSTVLIRQVDPSYEGHYICEASNSIGAAISKGIFLRVNVGARFRTRSANQSAVVGGAAVLVCEAEGDLPLSVTWSSPGRTLPPSRARSSDRHSRRGVSSELRLEPVARGDAGAYHCLAANNFGRDQASVHLFVREPPDVPANLHVQDAGSRWVSLAWGVPGPGDPPVLHYVLQHRPEAQVTWDNTTVEQSSRAARLAGLLPATTYSVRLLAVNAAGSSPPSDVLTVTTLQEAPHEAPVDVNAKATSPYSVVVQWKPPKQGRAAGDVLGYRVSARDASSSAQHLRIVRRASRLEVSLRHLRPYTRYEVAVRAYNAVGAGPPSLPVTVATLEAVPDEPPEDVQCAALSAQSVRVRWQPPPPDHTHGAIEGYKVLYSHANHKGGLVSAQVKKTTSLETTLAGLYKYTNYTVRVAAFTGSGEGPASSPARCATHEDVPGPPESIRALSMTSESILVCWTMPAEPNGRIIKFYVYSHSKSSGSQEVQKEQVLVDGGLVYEARQLLEHERYEYWVTAVTSAGEGPASPRVAQSPTSRVPARIASFPEAVWGAAGGRAVLPCRAVGLPAPQRWWRGPGGGEVAAPHRLTAVHDLELTALRPEHSGNYTCRAHNMFGRDEVSHRLLVASAPGPAVLSVAAADPAAVTLVWRASSGGSPVTGYVLKYKRVDEAWKSMAIDSDLSSYLVKDLKCGSKYQFSLTAVNAVGAGKPSPTITVSTKGDAPGQPAEEDLLVVNSTSATLYLQEWPDGGCPILWFAVEYRLWEQRRWWRLRAEGGQEELTVPDLAPATWYALRATAHSDAGSRQLELVFATKTWTGETVEPYVIPVLQEQQMDAGYQMNIVLPVISGVICTLAASFCACMLLHKRKTSRNSERHPGSEPHSLAEMENQRNLKQQGRECSHSGLIYLSSPTKPAHRKGSNASGREYEVDAYATFSLPYKDSGNHRTGDQAMDYCLQFQTFSQQECYAGQAASHGSATGTHGRPGKLLRTPERLEISCISSPATAGQKAGTPHHGVYPSTCDVSDSDTSVEEPLPGSTPRADQKPRPHARRYVRGSMLRDAAPRKLPTYQQTRLSRPE